MTEQAQLDESEITMTTGIRLKNARQEKGLECGDIARELKLDLKLIEALEADDVDKLPQPVYTAGYIRNYARLVALPADSLVEAYVAQETKDLPSLPANRVDELPDRYRQVAEALPRSFSIAAANARNATPVQYVAIGIGVLIAILIGWQSSRLMSDNAELAQDVPTTPGIIVSQDKTRISAAGKPAESENKQSSQKASKTENAGPTKKSQQASTSVQTGNNPNKKEKSESTESVKIAQNMGISGNVNPDQKMPTSAADDAELEDLEDNVTYIEKKLELKDISADSAGGDALALLQLQNTTDLTLTFTRNSWVDIRDATGKRLIRKLGIAGNSQMIKGVAPFQVLLGFGHGVTIEYNGKAVDFSAYQGNTVARFTLEVPREKSLP